MNTVLCITEHVAIYYISNNNYFTVIVVSIV